MAGLTFNVIYIFAAIAFLSISSMAYSIEHVVGGSYGWKVPPNATFYQEWAQTHEFAIGDKLVFLFSTGAHNILQVDAEDFAACTRKKFIHIFYLGPKTLELTEAGPHYYFDAVGTNCAAGVKLSINVQDTKSDPETLGIDVSNRAPPAKTEASNSPFKGTSYAAWILGLYLFLLYFLIV